MRSLRIAAGMATLLFMGPLLADDPSASPQQAIEKAQVLEHKAADKDPAPVPKAQTITPPEAQAVDPVGEKPVDDTLTCLARTIYWEAKGGTPADMQAVAHVVLNRLGHEGFPDSVCEVVKQGADKKVCQFSWWCDGRSDQVQEEDRYGAAKEIARKVLNKQLADNTGGAMYFHDRNVSPQWAGKYLKTAQTGKFIFYKPREGKAK
ncbi:cell wall hydrolase [Pseudomonas sp. M47T1]|uniref:cell wall hydrolase n=2 Tax=unclassified Pseudomonas TaxID=196821 RepID=UPI0005BB908C